jgi:hypothetical protein
MAKANAKNAGKKVPCTCGCGLDVAPSTKQNHLKGKGTTALRARVFAETKSLTMVDGPQHERQNNRNRGSKKRPASNSDKGGICKRLKPSQLESNAEPNVSQADIDPMDQLEASTKPESFSTVQAVPLPAVSTQSNNVVERTKHAIEQRWGGRQDNHCDEDEDEDDEDEDDEDGDDEDGDDEDEDEDDENERPGLSAWDLLGEAFEREAAALGSF